MGPRRRKTPTLRYRQKIRLTRSAEGRAEIQPVELRPFWKAVFVQPISRIPNPLISIAAITFVALGLRELAGRPPSKFYAAILVCSLSLMVAETIKSGLKFVFGRTWPNSFFQNNPSFIQDGYYGFNWFHGGQAYQSFPSGHMTAICAVASVLWAYYPRFRVVYVLVVLAALVGLVGANFHFLSDTIAGAFLGVSTGLMATKLLRMRQ
jgi:membrane-associated phospholipid phosphatase